ncbi:hypothetical protein MANES_09G014201v8 [Manihot esculenta]|uniref:Uncharacterized protein n=1 Tax=Manihot esculenta TaxID=3983 RepID=A0A2C9V6U8_MANES|nr:hypothetical protein MANES_09G014201v8 [Manihot esculenta]
MPSSRVFSRKMNSLFKILGQPYAIKSSFYYKLLSNSTDQKTKTPQVRKGYIAMYVGDESKRYQIRVENLKFPTLQELIKQSQNGDLDSKIDGPIVFACTTDKFDETCKEILTV